VSFENFYIAAFYFLKEIDMKAFFSNLIVNRLTLRRLYRKMGGGGLTMDNRVAVG
jgi:hypothetical protein